MARDRAVETALDAWREAERRLAAATPGTPGYVDAAIAVENARHAYTSAAARRYDLVGNLAALWSDDDELGAEASAAKHTNGDRTEERENAV